MKSDFIKALTFSLMLFSFVLISYFSGVKEGERSKKKDIPQVEIPQEKNDLRDYRIAFVQYGYLQCKRGLTFKEAIEIMDKELGEKGEKK